MVAGLFGLAPTLALAAAAQGVPTGVFPGDLPPAMADGRMLGHLPYPEMARSELVAAPPGFALGQPCLVHRDAAPDLTRMFAAAALSPGVGKALRGVSCFRTIAHQRAVFCRNAKPGSCADPARRARFVGPPGYSEHATGYAIDFASRPSPRCADVDACFATTPAGRWLLAHAPEFGFELSFPAGNAQGVTWEPWHWRWVGANAAVAGAARARLTVSRARADYPGDPSVADPPSTWLTAPTPAPFIALPPVQPVPPLPGPGERRRRKFRL
uniref:M15 family metallopeptidase n=1 Tax=uncultured Sphingomonas sp. TaxID=158754 RepID=UPI0035C9671E